MNCLPLNTQIILPRFVASLGKKLCLEVSLVGISYPALRLASRAYHRLLIGANWTAGTSELRRGEESLIRESQSAAKPEKDKSTERTNAFFMLGSW